MNILLSLLICARLYYLGTKAKRTLGIKAAEPYISLTAMTVESALPYTIMGIILLPFYTRGDDLAGCAGESEDICCVGWVETMLDELKFESLVALGLKRGERQQGSG